MKSATAAIKATTERAIRLSQRHTLLPVDRAALLEFSDGCSDTFLHHVLVRKIWVIVRHRTASTHTVHFSTNLPPSGPGQSHPATSSKSRESSEIGPPARKQNQMSLKSIAGKVPPLARKQTKNSKIY
jgi:hypothetical protein